MNADGSSQTQLTFDPASDFLPDWQVLPPTAPDTDNDGVADADDNCPLVANPDQEDICSFQDGDLLVGVLEQNSFGDKGKVVRVRGGQQVDFCESRSLRPGVPPFFNTPSEVLIDRQGRVVFLAYLGSNFDFVAQAGWGLWRCDAMGAFPTLLGAFGANPALLYPSPLGAWPVRHAGGLHLKRSAGVDLNQGTAAEAELYVFAVGDNCCWLLRAMTPSATSRPSATGRPARWTRSQRGLQMDMLYASGPANLGFPAGYTFNVQRGQSARRARADPPRLPDRRLLRRPRLQRSSPTSRPSCGRDVTVANLINATGT